MECRKASDGSSKKCRRWQLEANNKVSASLPKAACEEYDWDRTSPHPAASSAHDTGALSVDKALTCRVDGVATPLRDSVSAASSSVCAGDVLEDLRPSGDAIGLDSEVGRNVATDAHTSVQSGVFKEAVIYSEFVCHAPTKRFPHLRREDIECIVSRHRPGRAKNARAAADNSFGQRLCGTQSARAAIYNCVAELALTSHVPKKGDILSKLWTVEGDRWLEQKVNLQPRQHRRSFECVPDIYDYSKAPVGTMIVDFANRKVGGGCFGGGFVQEEQMVTQSTDLAVRLHKHRQILAKHEAVSYQGVHMDAWWDREVAGMKANLDCQCIQHRQSLPLTVFAVDAPVMRGQQSYRRHDLHMLAKKVTLVFAAAAELDAPLIFSGLLGGGAFRGNRPLILLLHLLLQPSSNERPVCFHHPVFWSFGGVDGRQLEQRIVSSGDLLLADMRKHNVETLGQALDLILASGLPLGESDGDLAEEPQLRW